MGRLALVLLLLFATPAAALDKPELPDPYAQTCWEDDYGLYETHWFTFGQDRFLVTGSLTYDGFQTPINGGGWLRPDGMLTGSFHMVYKGYLVTAIFNLYASRNAGTIHYYSHNPYAWWPVEKAPCP